MTFYVPRNITSNDQLLFDAAGNCVGIQPGGTSKQATFGQTAQEKAAFDSLVSGAWNLASSGTWRPAALGALPRFAVNGGASGGTWAISYRNAAGTVTSDPAEAVAAGASDVSPVFLDDATEIMVTITGTVTVEVK